MGLSDYDLSDLVFPDLKSWLLYAIWWWWQCDELVEHGALVCESPAEVIKKCKYTIAMLSDPCAALSVFWFNFASSLCAF